MRAFTGIGGTTFLHCFFPLVGSLSGELLVAKHSRLTEKSEGVKGEGETAVRLARIIRHVGDYYRDLIISAASS